MLLNPDLGLDNCKNVESVIQSGQNSNTVTRGHTVKGQHLCFLFLCKIFCVEFGMY